MTVIINTYLWIQILILVLSAEEGALGKNNQLTVSIGFPPSYSQQVKKEWFD